MVSVTISMMERGHARVDMPDYLPIDKHMGRLHSALGSCMDICNLTSNFQLTPA
ncbi:hypothetical protein K0M31_000406 [Melipona bicolor]|uniref:Uncharacterized protein n=1 Tax=Melipona bicolor TaxID=60889 RepID=A0AA40GEA1_9HYME|nr:hypothetical protein K0M31_000406 [Melipona bicolor]